MRSFFMIPLAALMVLPLRAPAWGDACNPEIQDCGLSAKDVGGAVLNSYQVKPRYQHRTGSECGVNIKPQACRDYYRRFLAGLAKENARAAKRGRGAPTRLMAASERRRDVYVIRERDRYEDEPRRPRMRCAQRFGRVGGANAFTPLAKSSAREQWYREVRSSLGDRYGAVDDNVQCHESGKLIGKRLFRCTFTATPCRS